MDEDTREALERSIKHWERVVLSADEPVGSSACPLCQKFMSSGSYICEGCPVEAAGHQHCECTPYVYYHDFMDEIYISENDTHEKVRAHLAEEEVEFLKSLLPEEGNGEDKELS